jgi:hypothetical protein
MLLGSVFDANSLGKWIITVPPRLYPTWLVSSGFF